MKTLKRIVAVSAKALMAVVVVGFLAYWGAYFYLQKRVGDEIAKIASRGEPVSLDDLRMKPIPDSQNSALVFKKMQVFGGCDWGEGPVGKKNPMLAEYDYDLCTPNLKSVTAKDWAEARKRRAIFESDFKLAEEALKRPGFYVKQPKDIVDVPGILSHARSMAKEFSVYSILLAKDGDIDGALRVAEVANRSGNRILQRNTMISYLVETAVANISSNASLNYIITHNDLTKNQAMRIAAHLNDVEKSGSIKDVMKGERAFSIYMYSLTLRGELVLCNDEPLAGFKGVAERIGGAFLLADELVYLKNAQIQIESLDKPFYYPQPKYEYPFYSLFSENVLLMASVVHARRQANLRIAGIAAGLSAYRRQFGEYPASLAELRAKSKWETPADPFSGKDFKYKKLANGFLLYSIGENMKDDNGVRDKNTDGSKDDIAWKIEKS